MALTLGPITIGNPQGLWALLALVPLILLYLIRPRPKQLQIPSLMFFMKSSGARKLTSFLKQFTKDWLFLIQLIFLLALVLTFADPFNLYQHDVTASNTVIVLDVSGSMQAKVGSGTRFDLAVSQAKKILGSKNTIILAKETPFIAVQDAAPDEAMKYLASAAPTESTSKIGEAIILAGETLGSEGRVVVLSDFINTGGQDPDIAKTVLENKGLVVDFINVAETPASNVGIIELEAGNAQTTVHVKNFESQRMSVPLVVGSSRTTLNINPNSVETFTFQTPPGVTKIEIEVNDDFAADNVAYLSAPGGGKAKVLLITNNATSFLKNALIASGEIDLTISEPPVIKEGKFEVIIIDLVDMNKVLPGTFGDVLERVENGASAIVAVQEDSGSINYEGLLPVKLGPQVDGGFIQIDQLNTFTKNIEFGASEKVFKVEPVGSQTVVASVNNAPVISIKPVGSGKVVYFGIPGASEFRYSPHYPIFWTELLKFLTERQDVRNLNFKTGHTLILDSEQKVVTPTKTVVRSAITMDDSGAYELSDYIITANLLNDLESSVNLQKEVGTKSTEYKLLPVKETREFPWTIWLIVIALIFVLFEVFFVKWRGDL